MEDQEALAKATRGPARVAWSIFALLAVAVAATLWRWPSSPPPTSPDATEFVRESAPPRMDYSEFNVDLDALPLDERIRRASVVLVTGIDREGETHKAIIREIYVIRPGTQFDYEVGDEFETLSHVPRDNCLGCEGDGQIVFLVGSPARMRVSYGFEGDRIESFGGIRLAEFRRRVQALAQAAAPTE